MIRKVRISLRYKFIFAITVLLLFTVGFYLSYALNIFQEDKAADVYSITLTNSISLSERVKLLINEELSILNLFNDENFSLNNKQVEVFKTHPNLLAVECLTSNNLYQSIVNDKKLFDLSTPFEFTSTNQSLNLLKKVQPNSFILENSPVKGLPPHFSIAKKLDQNSSCVLHISFEKLMAAGFEGTNYGSYIISDTGNMFLKLNDVKTNNNNLQNLIKDKTILNSIQGTKRFNEDGNFIIRSFSKIPDFNLIVITEIAERKAFLASEILIQKSLIYGILLLSIAVIVGILFTKRMTGSLQQLFEATTQLSEGNFNVSPVVPGHDEIGALSDSFVEMKDKIVAYMEQMKEKARIENEIKVAKIVQDSFFPKTSFHGNGISFTGHYEPATECSGDWWGYFEQGNIVTIIACDATGHGVPAALITAAAHSTLSTLKIESKNNYFSPRMILERMNKVICALNSEILMTAFAIEFDREKLNLKYSNASHMSPFLLRQVDKIYSKDNLIPLIENNGARLGESYNSKYLESELVLSLNDKIIMFSDGILEASNGEKVYGQRNFIKNICEFAPMENIDVMQASILNEFKKFTGNIALNDDITLICICISEQVPLIESEDELNSFSKKNESVISKLDKYTNLEKILIGLDINSIFGFNSKSISNEISLFNRIHESSKFNLSKVLKDFVNINKKTLISNSEISNQIDAVINSSHAFFDSALKPETVRLVLDELLSNAFYHSKDAPGFERGSDIVLIPGSEVELFFGMNQEFLVCSVKGPGNFQSKNKVLESILRGHREKNPIPGSFGAGLGMYLVYDNVASLWLVNDSHNFTQTVCFFEKSSRNKELKERITSFHYIDREISHE